MNIRSALNIFPRAITRSRIIHFVHDMELRNGSIVLPICYKPYICVAASFNIPPEAYTDFPNTIASIKGMTKTGIKYNWVYCEKCLKRIKELELRDYK